MPTAIIKLRKLTKRAFLIVAALILFVAQTSYAIYYFSQSALSAPGDGRMILLWDGGTAPTGWTCVSCTSGDPFYQTLPRGNDTYGGTGGSADHSHTASISIGATVGTASEAQAGNTVSAASHDHTASINISTESNLPLYRQLNLIRSNSQGQPSSIPAGAIGLFDTTLPSGWAAYNDQNGYYIYGENTAGTTGGSNTHSHSLSGALNAATGGVYGTRNGNLQPSAPAGHTHSYSGTGNPSNHEPPYIEVILGKLSIASAPPDGLIAMWDDEIPSNWTSQSTTTGSFYQRFLKGSGTFGTTGGGNSHGHTDSTITSSPPLEPAINSKSASATASGTHTHPVNITNFSNENHLPPYRNVIIGKKVPESAFEQSGYRFFVNSDSTDVGSPLAGNNSAASTPPQGQPFRLRMLINVSAANLDAGNKNFKLQYSLRSGTCDNSFVGESYNDVSTASGAIRYYDNATPSDGDNLTTNTNDPTNGTNTIVGQTYEEANNFTNSVSITAGDDGMWDFSLVDSTATAQTSYCFRAVEADGSLLDTYTYIPEIITDDGNGHMIIFYDGVSAPSGWTCVSCSVNDPYYQRFIKGAASYGTTGGSATHNHSASVITIGASNSNGVENTGVGGLASATHTHTASNEAVADASNLPPYRNLLVLRADNSGVPSTLPTGTIAMFDNTVPTGWTQYSAQDGLYVRGEATAGGTGGSLTHTHNLTATLDASIGSSTARTNGGLTAAAQDSHTHSVNGNSQAANNEPPYIEMILGKLNAASSVPQNIITYWDNPPPVTWTNLSTSGQPLFQNFAKPSASYGTTGGSLTHNHADSTVASGPPNLTEQRRTGTGTADGTHTHQVTFGNFSTENHEPPYIEAIAAKNGNLNTAPNNPASLKQIRTSDSSEIAVGGYSNGGQVKFEATATDSDNPDSLQLCVEVQQLGSAFTNSPTQCGSSVSYSGTAVTVDVTISGFTDGASYHWQAAIKDGGGALSAWVSYGANAETVADFTDDSSAPTGTVFDGTNTGVDVDFNGGALDTLSANWNISDASSGIDNFEYSIGTAPGATDVVSWTNIGTASSSTVNSLNLGTSEIYYFNVNAFDNAGNNAVISSDGQMVTPSISFSLSTSSVVFNNLNASNNFTDTEDVILTTSTNARSGYEVRAYAPNLLSSGSFTLPMFNGGTYANTDEWQGTDNGFGYTSSDNLVDGINRFLPATCPGGGASPCYAPFSLSSPGDIVADNNSTTTGSPISNEQFTITHRVTAESSQQAGDYQAVIIYSATAKY